MKIYQYTCIHRKYISIHVLCLLNIQISFNILFTSQNCLLAFFYKPVTINFLWLYLHLPSVVSNHYTLLPQKKFSSQLSFLYFQFIFSPFSFMCQANYYAVFRYISPLTQSWQIHLLHWFKVGF